MLFLVLLGLLLALVQSFIPAAFKARANDPAKISGPQDDLVWTPEGDRAQRALRNLHETLPIFLTLAVLAIVFRLDSGTVFWGALIYLIARVIYIPLFISGVSNFRSIAYLVSLLGLAMMAYAVLTAAPLP